MIRSRPVVLIGWLRFLAIIGTSCGWIPLSSVQAVDILVTSDADSGAGTLRAAIEQAVSGDRIVFNIPGTPTIQLASDLPDISGDISFANSNPVNVTIDRNGNGPIVFLAGTSDPSALNVVDTLGGGSLVDIQGSTGTTFFGASNLSGNILLPGTLAPGPTSTPGSVGTFDVTGNLDATGATFQLDLQSSGGPPQNDVVAVDGVLTVTGATLRPNFVGDQFQIGQNFVVINSTNPIVGVFSNQADSFALPNNPFLEAITNTPLTSQLGFNIQDNGATFASVASGCNQVSAATALDELFSLSTPPTAVEALRNGSGNQVAASFDQLSASIYPSLISAEINHIQSNLNSIRDRLVLQANSARESTMLVPWIRGYGLAGTAEPDKCLTPGYRLELGGAEIGFAISRRDGLSAFGFTHLAGADLGVRNVDQHADIDSYRLGGGFQYTGQHAYAFGMGGGGVQNYHVRRSLDAFEGSAFAESSFDGSSGFGYFEFGSVYGSTLSAVNPHLALQTTRVSLDSISETGDPEYSLINPASSGESLRGMLGMTIDKTGPTPIGPARSRLRFGWLHEFLDSYETIRSQLAIASPTPIALDSRGVAIGRDWGLVGFELDWAIFHFGQLTAGYQGHFNSRSAFNSFLAGIEWVW